MEDWLSLDQLANNGFKPSFYKLIKYDQLQISYIIPYKSYKSDTIILKSK